MTWGEPADKVLRAREEAIRQLSSQNHQAADLLAATATAQIGVNDTFWVVVTHINPGAQTEDTYCDFQLSELPALDEAEISTRLQTWATGLLEKGFMPRQLAPRGENR